MTNWLKKENLSKMRQPQQEVECCNIPAAPPRHNAEGQGAEKPSSRPTSEQHVSTAMSERWPEVWLYAHPWGYEWFSWMAWGLEVEKILGTSKLGR